MQAVVDAPPIRPFIRWAGGKSKLLPRIMPLMPATVANYYEPFLGGGAVFLALHGRVQGRATLADLNPHLVAAWTAVRDRRDELQHLLSAYVVDDSRETYYRTRAFVPDDELERAAWFLYLNSTSWNHLWRENSKTGAMNVPWGDRAFRGFDPEHLRSIASATSKATILAADFRVAVAGVTEGDLVYLDPPYLPVYSKPGTEKEPTSKFNKYTAKTFEYEDLKDLAHLCADITAKGATYVLSNRDTDSVRELFPNAEAIRFTTRRALAAQARREVEARLSPEIILIGRPT